MPAFRLHYWPGLQGRGEFVRLALEAAGAAYVDVARSHRKGDGIEAMTRMLAAAPVAPFAPPFLEHEGQVISHVANILQYLGPRLGLAPAGEAERLVLHGLQLTVTDFVSEVHDTHHPIASGQYFENQQDAARLRAADFRAVRMPKYLGYFEGVLRGGGTGFTVGGALSMVDLSLFQVVCGLRYAFPRATSVLGDRYPELAALHGRVGGLPRIAAYLASERRIAFNETGIFRYYPDLDGDP